MERLILCIWRSVGLRSLGAAERLGTYSDMQICLLQTMPTIATFLGCFQN